MSIETAVKFILVVGTVRCIAVISGTSRMVLDRRSNRSGVGDRVNENDSMKRLW